ncbi:hypothetical protein MUG87_09185 [Ectobacillus sp. JY-23]|uniref:hypothetical protein n=1 Tax=Ectobacillus sp. JY-23 TaxID=2933872 RepID=UPI001FF66857|nr:hypothetical protein [Ectobacillus sp. JY-23]UOY94242.1 hypothetical protein MUG87_09185 [Ectobacillus sp. JY-23]
MSVKWKVLSAAAVASLLFAGCGKEEAAQKAEPKQAAKTEKKTEEKTAPSLTEAEMIQAYKDGAAELEKAKAGQPVDFDKVTTLYKEKLQGLVQKRDAEFDEKIDQTIMAALEAGKNQQMEGMVVKQIFDKLLQKEFFQTMRHEFKEIDENWGNKEEVNAEYNEAVNFYKAIEGTVVKRDTANGTNMKETIDAGFTEMKNAIEKGDKLAFALGKQLVDKTLMKTFYLAAGDLQNGYATKAAQTAKQDEKEAKVQQAEGWAFYQAVYPYVKKHASEEADVIAKQFDLQTDVKTIDANAVNKAFVRGFAKIALAEYKESKENFDQDKGVITGLEGALFINVIEKDLKMLLGESEATSLRATAQAYIDAVKAKDKTKADQAMATLEPVLNKVVQTAK